MKRRIILISIIVAVIAVLVLAIKVYMDRNSSSKLLRRANLSLGQANDPQKALDLISTYLVRHPDDFEGISVKTQALMRLGRYDEAREILLGLLQSTELAEADRVSVLLQLNDSYAYPAHQRMGLPQTQGSLETLESIVADLHRADAFLEQAQPKEIKDVLRVREAQARHQAIIGLSQGLIADIFGQRADTAIVSGDARQAQTQREKSDQMRQSGQDAMKQAVVSYLFVVGEDPDRIESARSLIELCNMLNDQESLTAAREALAKSANPPMEVTILLLHQEVMEADRSGADPDRLRDISAKLERLLEENPDNDSVLLENAEVALRLEDFGRMETYLNRVLSNTPRQTQARILQARMWLSQGELSKAEKAFFSLKSEIPYSADLQYFYGQAAYVGGKKELARQAMRIAATINPRDPRPRAFLAQSLLEDGFYDQAMVDAQAYYDVAPQSPDAVNILVQAAFRADQFGLVRKIIEGLKRDSADKPEMLVICADGYRLLNEPEQQRAVMEMMSRCTPQNPRQAAAVAGAFLYLNQLAPAENLLLEELKRHPSHVELNFQLGRLYAQTNRSFQAEEYYRRALSAETANKDRIRLELAQTLMKADDLDQALEVLNTIEAPNPRVNLLRLQINMIKGEPLSADQVLAQGESIEPLEAAMAYFYSGQFDECAKICQAELQKNTQDEQVRTLLAQTYQQQQDVDKSRMQWSRLLQGDPGNMYYYISLANLLRRSAAPDEVQKQLEGIPNVGPDQIAMTMGWLYEQNRQYEEALNAYSRVLERPGVAPAMLNRVRLLRARVWALQGDINSSVAELDRAGSDDTMRPRALLTKARLLVAARQTEAAGKTVEELESIVRETPNLEIYKNIVGLYAQLDQNDKALVISERMVEQFPRIPGAYMQRASVWRKMRQFDKAVADYRRAVECQPGDLGLQRQLVRALDEQRDLEGALEVLDEVEKMGQTGQSMARYERGVLFNRWGLPQQAIESFEALARSPQGQNPRVQMVLADTFARLGRKKQVQDIINKIPDYSNEYVSAQLLAARIAEDTGRAMKSLQTLQTGHPQRSDIAAQLMNAFLDANRPEEAFAAMKTYLDSQAKETAIPAALYEPMVRTLGATPDRRAALDVARELGQTQRPDWKYLALLLALETAPDQAGDLLASPDQAGLYDAALGLCHAALVKDQAAAKQWALRLNELVQQMQNLNPPRRLPGEYRLLAGMILGPTEEAEVLLKDVATAISIDGSVVEELRTHSQKQDNERELVRLLQANVALDLGLAPICRNLALQVLQNRPACQWAAAMLITAQPDQETLEQATRLLEPKNSLIAQLYQAQLYSLRGEYQRAVDIMQDAVKQSPRREDLQFRLASVLENAGRYEEALGLYRELWQANKNYAAANNAAYMVTLLTPEDKEQLRQAREWIDAVLAVVPNQPAFQESRGWISLLLGEKEAALTDLRQTIGVLADSPEAHYHLALAEMANGNGLYAQWHLEAAVELGEKAIEQEPRAVLKSVVAQSRKELAKLKTVGHEAGS